MSIRRRVGQRKVADMSLPPEDRRRRRRKGGTPKERPTAIMDHGSSSRARKRATEGEKLMAREWGSRTAWDRHWARFGDAYHELPRTCWLPEPQLVQEPRYGTRTGTSYDQMVRDLLGRGVPVPDHPSACAWCGHAQVRHKAKTRYHPCQVLGCDCARLVRQDMAA